MEGTRSLAAAGSGDGLERALAAKRQVARDEAREFDHLLTHLADCGTEGIVFAGPGSQRLHRYGGSGTPQVAEFAVCEIASTLGLSPHGAAALVADILDLAHRLPRLYAALHAGLVETWRVRKAATATRTFTIAQAEAADRRLSADTLGDQTPMLCRVSPARLRQILEQIRNRTCPDETEQDYTTAQDERRVTIRPIGSGLAALDALISDEDGTRLEQRLTQIVTWLHTLGDERPATVLRAVALGYLTEPDSLDLLYDHIREQRTRCHDDTAQTAHGDNDGSVAGNDAGVAESEGLPWAEAPQRRQDATPVPEAFRRGDPIRRLPATTVYLHLDRASHTWSMDGIGAITDAEAHEIIGHSQVTVKPVIDLAANLTYTGYVAPPRLREQLALMNAGTCTFPYCDRPARTGEYDHILDHADGGPTDSRNGHRLCKFHHRAKTFTTWTVQSPAPGTWIWHSPAGRTYLVTAGTTTRIDSHRHREKPHAA